MEFCELGDLSYFIKKRDTLSRHPTTSDMIRKYPNPAAGGLNEVVARHFLKQLASALQFLRAKNFIHRDVKPQNLLLDPSPQYYRTVKPEHIPYAAHDRSMRPIVGVESLPTLKLADFGFARSLPSTSLAETLCGSPLYMAPEILRYEKYDAKADLWSVGTVLNEMMTGKPPFRASNHVELLRKIERGEDRIRFPEEVDLSDSMKKMIRGLLKRNPVERMGFEEFFNHAVVKDEIPGLVEDDKPAQLPKLSASPQSIPNSSLDGERPSSSTAGSGTSSKIDAGDMVPLSSRRQLAESPKSTSVRGESSTANRTPGTPPRSAAGDMKEKRYSTDRAKINQREATTSVRRPSMTSHATAPARHDLHTQEAKQGQAVNMQGRTSKRTTSDSPASQERIRQRERLKEARAIQERAAQDVADERDYVVVDKRNVEVNAFADELAANPRISRPAQMQQNTNRGALVRRATTQGSPASATGAQAQALSPRTTTTTSSKRPDPAHNRQNSYERRLRDGSSATSAISKALTLASGRLLGLGFSPPLGFARNTPSAATYSPFPAFPTAKGSLLMLEDVSKTSVPLDEDAKAAQAIEESATRSNVVYGFAEIKFQQLIPAAPSTDNGLGIQSPTDAKEEHTSEDVDLNIEATVICAEEAFVLYVKALSLLAHAMTIAHAWWAKNKPSEESNSMTDTTARSPGAANVGRRVNNVVQWVRGRFNEVLEKAEFVRLKLIDAQKQLPEDHPNHSDGPIAPSSSTATGSAASSDVPITSGITAEKLMYDYALEKSRSAAVSELVGDNLPGCEIDYNTAIWLLEAILEDDEDETLPGKDASLGDKEDQAPEADDGCVNGVEAEDRKHVITRKFLLCLPRSKPPLIDL